MSYRAPLQRRMPLDQYDLLVWSMDEVTVPFQSSGTNRLVSLTKGFNPSNIRENRAGIFDQACDFVPANTLTTGDTSVVPSGTSFTISCWAYCRSFPNPSVLVGKTYHLTGTGWNNPYWSVVMAPTATTGVFYSGYSIAGTITDQSGPGSDPFILNTWTLVALTYDGHRFKQYINGNLIEQSTDLGGAAIDWGDGGPWCVGGNMLTMSGGFDGLIDDVRISTVPRSAAYLQQQFKNGLGWFELPEAQGFVPTDVPGAVLWLRSDKGVDFGAEPLIGTLHDESGFEADATQTTSGSQPSLVPYGQNGHPYIACTASPPKYMTGLLTTQTAPLSDVTFFVVARFADQFQRVPFCLTDSSFNSSSGVTFSSQNSPNRVMVERWTSGSTQTTSMSFTTSKPQIYSATSSPSVLQGYINGLADGTPAGPTSAGLPISGFVIGADEGTGTFAFAGDLYEALVYDRVLGSTDLDNITAYLKKKYSIGFTPTDISGCVLWSRADRGVTLVGGGVDLWADQSPSGIPFVAPNAGARPVFVRSASGYNNHPTFQFDQMNASSLATVVGLTYGSFTIFAAMQIDVASTPGLIFDRNTAANQEYVSSDVGPTTYITRDSGTTVSAFDVIGGWADNATPYTLTEIFDGTHASHLLRINGNVQSKTTTGGGGGDPGTGTATDIFGLFAQADGSALHCSGTLAEIAIYDRALSADEIAAVEEYLRSRYEYY